MNVLTSTYTSRTVECGTISLVPGKCLRDSRVINTGKIKKMSDDLIEEAAMRIGLLFSQLKPEQMMAIQIKASLQFL